MVRLDSFSRNVKLVESLCEGVPAWILVAARSPRFFNQFLVAGIFGYSESRSGFLNAHSVGSSWVQVNCHTGKVVFVPRLGHVGRVLSLPKRHRTVSARVVIYT